MKNCLSVILVFLLIAAAQSLSSQAAVSINDLPPAVREALNREADDFRIRGVNKAERDGKTLYIAEARSRHDRKLVVSIGESGSVLSKIYDSQISVAKNQLLQEGQPFVIQSIYTPTAGDYRQTTKEPIQSIGAMSAPGGNAVAFDLYGFNPDGRGLTPEADAFYQKLLDRLAYIKIGGIIRVFNPSAPPNAEFRYNAIRTAAQYFRNENQFIYWIDGPNAEMLAKVFKSLAPGLTVAAPGGDVQIIDSASNPTDDVPSIKIYDAAPKEFPAGHVVLTNTKRNIQALDRKNAWPEENQPWTPDNSSLSESERREGFIALFDGKTANGWLPLSHSGKGFIVKDGTLQRVPGGGSIRSLQRYGDFVLRLDFQIEKNGNSGVQVRCPRVNRQSKIGFEVQILGDEGQPVSSTSTGSIYNVIAPTANASKPAGEWNSMEITCKGSFVKIILNGQQVQDLNFDNYDELRCRLREGFIILTDHGNAVAYRNIRIKKL